MAVGTSLLPLSLALLAASAAPAFAQTDPLTDLDALSRASTDVAPGLSLAKRQVAAGELTSAAATLERLLMQHPESDDALLLHASLLCRLDDAEGAWAEVAELAGHPVAPQAWAPVTAACGPGIRRG